MSLYEYIRYKSAGPFVGRLDPWAEQGVYFHQIHGNLIGRLIERLVDPLARLGYVLARETSLQILEPSQPDTVIAHEKQPSQTSWHYADAARRLEVDPGVATMLLEPPLDAIHIRGTDEHRLVTIIEIISPKNKMSGENMELYLTRRLHKVRVPKVNIVEIDLTRSVKRLIRDDVFGNPPYHIAIHLPHEPSYLLELPFDQPLKPFALPLHQDVILVDPQPEYDAAYRSVNIGGQIEDAGEYTLEHLPFPSTLTLAQRADALAAVETWRTKLEQLRPVD